MKNLMKTLVGDDGAAGVVALLYSAAIFIIIYVIIRYG
jgi:hypothetical protein